MNEILVSIICNTYNHEKYIADAIESFLMQETNFKYEILIHDDASTDRTAEIIKEYEKKYPEIIKSIYQKENQYSKGVKVDRLNSERAVGKYHAICEGDDYWTDCLKLQKQVNFLEENPNYILCVHAAKLVDAKLNIEVLRVRPSSENRSYSTEEIIYGGGGFFATNSMVYRSEGSKIRTDFYNNAPVGDYPLTILLSLAGKVYYMEEVMSVYRTNVEGSWTSRHSSVEKVSEVYTELNQMLDEINEHTKGKYAVLIDKTKLRNQFRLLIMQDRYKEIKSGEYKIIYDLLSKREKIKIFIKHYLPNTLKLLKILKRNYIIYNPTNFKRRFCSKG